MADEPPQDLGPWVPDLPEHSQTQLADFFNNADLSDCIIKNPDTEDPKGQIPVHKAILASGSSYFLSIFKKDKEKPDDKIMEHLEKGLDFPRPV